MTTECLTCGGMGWVDNTPRTLPMRRCLECNLGEVPTRNVAWVIVIGHDGDFLSVEPLSAFTANGVVSKVLEQMGYALEQVRRTLLRTAVVWPEAAEVRAIVADGNGKSHVVETLDVTAANAFDDLCNFFFESWLEEFEDEWPAAITKPATNLEAFAEAVASGATPEAAAAATRDGGAS